ncbi:hypothetical protein QQ045_004616 [Rhodiola kirilowii]
MPIGSNRRGGGCEFHTDVGRSERGGGEDEDRREEVYYDFQAECEAGSGLRRSRRLLPRQQSQKHWKQSYQQRMHPKKTDVF